MEIKNPATDEVIISLKPDTKAEIGKKVAMLKKGQKEWAKQTLDHRLSCMVRFGELIQENRQELALILTSETGKPIQQALNEIKGAQNRIDTFEPACQAMVIRGNHRGFWPNP